MATLSLSPGLAGAVVLYDEVVDGDARPGEGTYIGTLPLGTSRILGSAATGSPGFDSDFDTFAFTVADGQVLSSIEFLFSNAVFLGQVEGATTQYQMQDSSGSSLGPFFSKSFPVDETSPQELFMWPLAPGDYTLKNVASTAGPGPSGGATWDYQATISTAIGDPLPLPPPPPAPIPLPAGLPLLLAGLGMLGLTRFR